MKLNLDYIHLVDSERYAFYIAPRILYKSPKYKKLSGLSRVLYSLMLARLSLSKKNSWLDEDGRVYICYTIADIILDLGCTKNTASKILEELCGIGLIEKKRIGLTKASLIYVNNYTSIAMGDIVERSMSEDSSSWLSEVDIDNFIFFKIPQMLFTHEAYKELSVNAKIIYSLMLDKVALSKKNNWFDKDNNIYINYTLDELAEDSGLSRRTVATANKELESIGLVEKKRNGFDNFVYTYVKDFYTVIENGSNITGNDADIEEISVKNDEEIASSPLNSTKVQNLGITKCNSSCSQSAKFGNQEVQDLGYAKCKIWESEVQDLGTNYIDSNKTEINYTDISYLNSIYPSNQEGSEEISEAERIDKMDGKRRYDYVQELVKQNICFDSLLMRCPLEQGIIASIVNILTDVICFKKDFVIIEGTRYPWEHVRDRFLLIDDSHIEYILEVLSSSDTRVKNIKAYLLTTLYNSVDTIDIYYQSQARADLKEGSW